MSAEGRATVFSLAGLPDTRLTAILRPPLERLLGLNRLKTGYLQIPPNLTPRDFLARALEHLGITWDLAPGDLEQVPREGPVVIVANHPFGAIEGMALASLLLGARSDVRILANFVLGRVPELRELFLLVDPFAGEGAARRSMKGLRDVHHWLSSGGLLVVFPAGEVAHLDLRQRAVVDPPWLPTVARLVRRAECPVVPVLFSGHNGPLFQLAGLVHPSLRTAMLPRELLARRDSTLHIRIGAPIPYSELRSLTDDDAAVSYLRKRTEILAERPLVSADPVQPRRTPIERAPVAPAVVPAQLEAEILGLDQGSLLATSGGLEVRVATFAEIPNLLREIGRLRELTFRAAGEGTGRDRDLDAFDQTYEHLFIWNPNRREIVGAYRIGRTRELLAAGRIENLYTSTLFRFNRKLFDNMGPALEMGRSFIRLEYQRSFAGLLLLWKGIGEYILRHPECATLFGPVSISADYHSASQQLIAAFLKQNAYNHPWSRWVRPRSAFKQRPSRAIRHGVAGLCNLAEVSRFIAEIEADRKGVPVLLRQYLRLGGRLLGFNVDPEFSDVLDVLVMVDLRKTPPRTLARYMGRDGAASFRTHHGLD